MVCLVCKLRGFGVGNLQNCSFHPQAKMVKKKKAILYSKEEEDGRE